MADMMLRATDGHTLKESVFQADQWLSDCLSQIENIPPEIEAKIVECRGILSELEDTLKEVH